MTLEQIKTSILMFVDRATNEVDVRNNLVLRFNILSAIEKIIEEQKPKEGE